MVGSTASGHSSSRENWRSLNGPCKALVVVSTIPARTSGRYSSDIEVSYVTTGVSTTPIFGTVPITGTWDPA